MGKKNAEVFAAEFKQGLVVPCTLIPRMSQLDYRISEEKILKLS